MEHLICIASTVGSVIDKSYDSYPKPLKAQLENWSLLRSLSPNLSYLENGIQQQEQFVIGSESGRPWRPGSRIWTLTDNRGPFKDLFWTKWVTWSKKCLGRLICQLCVECSPSRSDSKMGVWTENSELIHNTWRTNQVQQLSIQTNIPVHYSECSDHFQVTALKLWIIND